MKSTITTIALTIVAILLLLSASFYGGYRLYGYRNPCPEITPDTVLVYDTISHFIKDTIPWYDIHRDTTIYYDTIPFDIDTNQIIKEYFALHVFEREWADSLLKVKITDVITQNRPTDNIFEYTILKPSQTIINNIDNSVHYNKYLALGVDVPIKDPKYTEFETLFHWKKGYVGMGYTPWIYSINVKAGVNILKFKR